MEMGSGVLVREYDPSKDLANVEELEKRCELGSFLMSQMGDAVARVRHFPAFHMLVAETDDERTEMVGVIRGGVKNIKHGIQLPLQTHKGSGYVKVGYVSGLRVLPSHRNKGIAIRLVRKMEDWFQQNEAEYAYMQADHDNHASIKLFTTRCGYEKFRQFKFAMDPVFAHRLPTSRKVNVMKVPQGDALALYQHYYSEKEFFPEDIGSLLSNKLCLGTFVAVPGDTLSWQGSAQFVSKPPDSWAMISYWNARNVYRMVQRNGSGLTRMVAKAARMLDQNLPFLGIPSIPDLFSPFGYLFVHGVAVEGPRGSEMIEAIRAHAHNVALESNCEFILLESASCELVRSSVSGWREFPTHLYVKWIGKISDGARSEWIISPPSTSFCIDPRDI